MICCGWYLVPLAIGILCLIQIEKVKSRNEMMIWAILALIFVSPLAGIFMVLIDEKELNPAAANKEVVVEEIVEIVEVDGVAKERIVRKQAAAPTATVVKAEPKKPVNGMAIASLIVSLVVPPVISLLTMWFMAPMGIVGNIVGLILGAIGAKKAKTIGSGKGMSVASIIISILGILVGIIYAIVIGVLFALYGAAIFASIAGGM
jgi:hypothetical protein